MKKIKAICVFLLLTLSNSTLTFAFTQSGAGIDIIGSGVPMGHEWVTRISAFEVIGGDPLIKPDPRDPRRHWTQGKAKNIVLGEAGKREANRIKSQGIRDARYQSTYDFIFSAIIGERWVDIGGVNLTKATVGKINCWDAAVQQPAEIQQDHFMRRYDDNGAKGGVNAAVRAQQRFIRHFVQAAMASPQKMKVWDGGGYTVSVGVDHNYFLFGRAAHLFEDAFSSEHTVRLPIDNYEKIRQVKSYLCATGAEQHSHSTREVLKYKSGDVIWKVGTRFQSGWQSYKASNMKDLALVSIEASKDLWAAFIRTMATPLERRATKAKEEAQTLVKNWLSFDKNEMMTWYNNENHRIKSYVLAEQETGKGISQAACMKHLGVKSGSQIEKVNKLKKEQRICIYNINAMKGYQDLNDPFLHMPFNWSWKSSKWLTPPSGWKIPNLPADSGKKVIIRSAGNNQSMIVPEGIRNNAWIYTKEGIPLQFTLVGDPKKGVYMRTIKDPNLFLSYRDTTGAVKLFASSNKAKYQLFNIGNNKWAILNMFYKQYMWVYKGISPYVTKKGNPQNRNAQWFIDGL